MIAIAAWAPIAVGCQREEREPRLAPAFAEALNALAAMPNGISGAPPQIYTALGRPYENNAYQLSQGKRLYAGFGCRACHGDGEGGAGPSFLDGSWRYGPSMVSIAMSIRDGRRGGMPPYRDRLTTEQIWQLAGYVQTIGSYDGKAAAPGRNDEAPSRPAENRAPAVAVTRQTGR